MPSKRLEGVAHFFISNMNNFFIKISIGFLVLALCANYMNAQSQKYFQAFSKSFEIASEKKGKEKFKGQIIKGKRSGMGLYLFKDGSVYAGDFYMNSVTGFGMLLASGQITNCDNCQVYVGNFKDGKKSGSGICYNENGNIIYQGQFLDDKPIETYPSINPSKERHFSFIDLGSNNTYVGEFTDKDINGFGVIIFSNGDVWQSQFKNGNQKGIGLYLSYDGEWETINYKDNANEIISSSEKYREQADIAKANFNKALSGAFEEFKKAGSTLMALVNDINSSKGESVESDNEDSTPSGSSSGSKSSSKSKQSGSDVEAKNKDQRSYSGFESQLIKMNTYYETEYSDSHRREIQSKMKRIREKWESRGFQMFRSSWEDWDGHKK